MERRNLIIAVVLVAIIGVSTIGVVLMPPVSAKATFTESVYGDVDSMDPAVAYDTASGEVIQNVYETLVWYKGESATDIIPWLAESWNVSADGMTYTFVLRQGIKFTDGSPFNAYVMKWSLDRDVLFNYADGPAWMYGQCVVGAGDYMYNEAWETGNRTAIYEAALAYLNAGGIEVISDYVLRIHISYNGKPYPPFIQILAGFWGAAVDPTYVMANGGSAADDPSNTNPETMSVPRYFHLTPSLLNGMGVIPGCPRELSPLEKNAIGTGPFVLAEWTKGVRVRLERNQYYWGSPYQTGIAKLEKVIIERVDEHDTRKLKLLAGEADWVAWDPIYADQIINVTSRQVLPAHAADISTILDKPTLIITAAGLNMNKTLNAVTATKNVNPALGEHENPIQYQKFRQAIQYAFDHALFIKALNGFALTPNSVIIQGIFGYDPNIPTYEFNKTKAAKLLDEVGWAGTINIYYNEGNDVRRKACLILKDGIGNASALASVGKVEIKVNSLDWPTFLDGVRKLKFPMFFIGWVADYPDADNFIITYAHSKMGTYAKRIVYKNATIDSMLEEAATELNPTARQALYTEASMELYRQACYLLLYQPLNFRVYRSWVQGMYFNPILSGGYFYSYWKV